jgi:PKD repeat protein
VSDSRLTSWLSMSLPGPVAEFTVSPLRPSTSRPVQFVDCSHDPGEQGIAWRAWDFGDGETSVGASPTHRYGTGGSYEVTLTLATFDGRVARRSRHVAVAVEA